MVAILRDGQITWSGSRDDEGHRDYKVTWLVQAHSLDGPAIVMTTPGLPQPGMFWLVDNDIDAWAFCKPNMTVKPVLDKEPNRYWLVEQTFSTKPPENDKERCNDQQIEDPLQEPMKVSGGFAKHTEEALLDKDGEPIFNTAFEPLRGSTNEWDRGRPTVRIEQNVPSLGLETFSGLIDHVNDSPLWGCPARCVKLSNVSWERKYYGTCNVYYTRSFDFDINFDTFDRQLWNEGTKALNGRWGSGRTIGMNTESTGWILIQIGNEDPDPANPAHYSIYKDRKGEPGKCMLNTNGKPVDVDLDEEPNKINVRKYIESNLLVLGLPTTL